jgi:V/A-type H+-transporting ATPase subunit I
VRPFELFIKILRPPKYGSIDPTPYFAFFFPIFFGLIMGDIGYGLVFLGLALILRFKTKKEMLKNVAEVILMCSGYTIFFGFVFGEFFGDWLEKMGVLHPLKMKMGGTVIEWNRMHSLLPLLILAIAIGVFHVTLGFVLKLIQSVRHRHTHETVEVIAILAALAGLFTLLGVTAQQIPGIAKIPSVIVILISLPLLIFMKGPMMLIELLSFVGNMLSYARLMAVGVASAYLAFVGNMLGGLMGNIIIGAIVAILFHIINMVLAFSPTIQSARLHYVEFFSKFYESGGHLYQPLAKSRKKTNN